MSHDDIIDDYDYSDELIISSGDIYYEPSKKHVITIFESFPREVGIWKKWCHNIDEYREFVANANGIIDCYCSIFRQTQRWNRKEFGDAMEAGSIVDKVYLDVDTKFGHESAIVAHEILEKRNILHCINASGRWDKTKIVLDTENSHNKHLKYKQVDIPSTTGFHVYYWIVPSIQNKKAALFNLQKDMCEQISKKLETGWGVKTVEDKWVKNGDNHFKIGEWELPDDEIYAPVDTRIWGDILRISRITNTWNPKRNRFCIPVSDKMIKELDANAFQELAKKQVFLTNTERFMGQKMMRVPKEFDIPMSTLQLDPYIASPDENPNPNVLNDMELPICIRKLLCDSRLDVDRRFWLLVYLRDKGVSMEEAQEIFLKFLDPEWAHHSVFIERQPWHVYRGNQRNISMKNCYVFSKFCNCEDECPVCPRYDKRHPVYK